MSNMVPAKGSKTFTLSQYAEATDRLKVLRNQFLRDAWEFATELRKVHQSGVWAYKHNTWESYVVTEIGVQESTASHYMRSARLFTQTQFLQLGPTRAKQIAAVAKKDRPAIIKKTIDNKLSTRALAEELSKLRGKGRSSSTPPADGPTGNSGQSQSAFKDLVGMTWEALPDDNLVCDFDLNEKIMAQVKVLDGIVTLEFKKK